MDFYETCVREIPVPPVEYSCLVSGPLSKIADPNLVIMFCTPKQADILVRSQSYQGTLVKGFGGNGGCIFNIRHAFVTREMTFSTSDFPWRTFVGLDDSELTVTFPYEKLLASAPYIQPIIDYVDNLKQVFGTAVSNILQERLAADMENKVAIVTGASMGIGRAIACILADEGYDIVCAARSKRALAQTAEDVRSRGAEPLPCRPTSAIRRR